MFEFRRRVGNQNVWKWHRVYDGVEEFKGSNDYEGKGVKDWWKCEEGDWGLTTDGYVAYCKKIYVFKGGVRQLSFSFGEGRRYKESEFNFMPYWEKQCFGGMKPRTWADRELKNKRMIPVVAAAVQKILEGGKNTPEDLVRHYVKRKTVDMTWMIRKLMKTEEWKKMIKKEVREAFKEKGFDEGDTIDVVLDAIKIAKNKKDANNMLKGADTLIDLMDMAPPKQQVTKSIEMNQLNEIEGVIEREENNLLLTETVEGGVDEEAHID